MRKISAASLAIAMMTSTSVLAQTVKYDETVAKAAAAKAAEKIGDIRGTIGYDETPDIVTKEDLKDTPVNTSFLPQPSTEKQSGLPPMTSNAYGVDLTTTGSISVREPGVQRRVIWEKFDRYGNPIK